MGNALSSISASGQALPSVQPVKDSVPGSPFTVGVTSIGPNNEIGSRGIVVLATESVHIAFNGTAEVSDILIPAGQWFHFPTNTRDRVAFVQAGTNAATVYVQQQREIQ